MVGLATSQYRRGYHPGAIILGDYNPGTPYGRPPPVPRDNPYPPRDNPHLPRYPVRAIVPLRRPHDDGPRRPIRYGRKYTPVLTKSHYDIGITDYGRADVTVDQGGQGFRYSVEQKHPDGGYSSVYSSASIHH